MTKNKGWREHNRQLVVESVADIIQQMTADGETPNIIAEELAAGGYIHVYKHRRMWTYGKGRNTSLGVFIGGDEYGNSVLDIGLPGGYGLAIALNVPLRRKLWTEEDG